MSATVASSLNCQQQQRNAAGNSESEIVYELVNLSLLGGLLGGTTPLPKRRNHLLDAEITVIQQQHSGVHIDGYEGGYTLKGGSANDIYEVERVTIS